MRKRVIVIAVLLALALRPPQTVVRADMAPPMAPPGSNLLPGGESTYVRMMAETVTMVIETDPTDQEKVIGRTTAVFTMRNIGTNEERMQARFPLSFSDGGNDGYFNYPEIPAISVKVDGRNAATRREMQPPYNARTWGEVRPEVPWAVFEVAFPPQKDVRVEVAYVVNGYGYYPQFTFDYILETGAGWHGTIGSADIILRLPYEVDSMNVMAVASGMPEHNPAAGTFRGNEIVWHYDSLEPTAENNISVAVISPSLWSPLESDKDALSRNPNDGEAWGRLGKAYKEAARMGKGGYPREDAGGLELVRLSEEAYKRCLAILPEDPLWHYGYADLLWMEYWWLARRSAEEDLLSRTLTELQSALALDPDNPQAMDLLGFIEASVPGSVESSGDTFVFLGLTATPLPPTHYPIPTSASPATAPATPRPRSTGATELTAAPSRQPSASNPLCGGGFAVMLLPFAALFRRRWRAR